MGECEIKGIIFDLDGVIVFTDKYHYQAWKKTADRLEVYFDENINNRLRGISRMESLEILLEQYKGRPLEQEEKNELANEKNIRYRELLSNLSPSDAAQEVKSTLIELRRRGYKLAIGSSSRNAKFILEKVGLSEYFDAVSDGTNIEKSKPNPEVFIKAAEFLGLRPEKCIVVEDAVSGIDAAKRCKMKAAGIGDAYLYHKTDYPIKTIADLLILLD